MSSKYGESSPYARTMTGASAAGSVLRGTRPFKAGTMVSVSSNLLFIKEMSTRA